MTRLNAERLPTVVLPDDTLDAFLDISDGLQDHDLRKFNVVKYDWQGPLPEVLKNDAASVIAVPPYMQGAEVLQKLKGTKPWLVQSASIGFDGVAKNLPEGIRFANAASVHEASTAELGLGLILASLRGIPDFVRAADRREWSPETRESLADKRVLVIGVGGVGAAVISRLEPFETSITRVASAWRIENGEQIFGINELAELLPAHDIVILTVPLTPATTGLVDSRFLASMKRGALLVNLARGPVVVTDDLVQALKAGRVHAALDVTDPEPLPTDHPLWSAPNLLLSPHVGGNSTAMPRRLAALIERQVENFLAGREPDNLITF